MKKLLAYFMVLCMLLTIMTPIPGALADDEGVVIDISVGDGWHEPDEPQGDAPSAQADDGWMNQPQVTGSEPDGSGVIIDLGTPDDEPTVTVGPDNQDGETVIQVHPDETPGPDSPEIIIPIDPENTNEPDGDDAEDGGEEEDEPLEMKPEGETDPALLEGELGASLASATAYAFAGENTITLRATIRGGSAPYTVRLRATNTFTGEHVCDRTGEQTAPGVYAMAYAPAAFGPHRFELIVTDAEGAEARSEVEVLVPVREYESRDKWERSVSDVYLTGDPRVNLVEVAKTQLGYKESSRNFIIDELGRRMGYTRYGAWYGADYGEWCAMFVSFCANYAKIPAAIIPRAALVQDVIARAKGQGAYEGRGYAPQTGDLVFFDWERDGVVDHMGIVESADALEMTTIEGNSANEVRLRRYTLGDPAIIGYVNLTRILVAAGVLDESELAGMGEPVPEQEAALPELIEIPVGTVGATLRPGVNLRETANPNGNRLAQIALSGTQVRVLSMEHGGGTAWYQVSYDGQKGYIRYDLVELQFPGEPQSASITEQPAGLGYEQGDAQIELAVGAEHAVAWRWQRAQPDFYGEMTWEDVPGQDAATLILPAEIEHFAYAYRCVVTGEDGERVVSDTAVLLRDELLTWVRAGGVTMQMLERALGAKSLESMVFEDGKLIYVRTGEVFATYNAETGELIDCDSGLVVATLDMSSGKIRPRHEVKDDGLADDDGVDSEFAG